MPHIDSNTGASDAKYEVTEMNVPSAVRWNAGASWIGQMVHFVVAIVLVRLLEPEDYGLLTMATVFTGFFATFRSLGFEMAVIQKKEVNDGLLSGLFFINIAVGLALTALTVGASPLVSWIYNDPRVMPVMAVSSLSFVFQTSKMIPSSILTRKMRFDLLGIIRVTSGVVSGIASITLAVLGWGVWAIVIGSLLGNALVAIMTHAMSPWRPRLVLAWSEVRTVMNFGLNVTGFQMVNYLSRNADDFIIGKFLGPIPLGYYSLAYGILLKPRDAITQVLATVLFPALSRMQDNNDRFRSAYGRACGAIAFCAFPIMLGLVSVVEPFVGVVLGEKWRPAIPLIYVLAPLGMFQSVLFTTGQVFLAKGRADLYFRIGVLGAAIMITSFALGCFWGVLGVAIAYAVSSLLVSLLRFLYASRLIPNIWSCFLMSILPHFRNAILMLGAVLLLRLGLTVVGLESTYILVVTIPFGAVVYLALVILTQPPAMHDFLELMPDRYAKPIKRLLTRRPTQNSL